MTTDAAEQLLSGIFFDFRRLAKYGRSENATLATQFDRHKFMTIWVPAFVRDHDAERRAVPLRESCLVETSWCVNAEMVRQQTEMEPAQLWWNVQSQLDAGWNLDP